MAYDWHLDDGTHIFALEMREHSLLFWQMDSEATLLSRFCDFFRDGAVTNEELATLIQEIELRSSTDVSEDRVRLLKRFLAACQRAQASGQGMRAYAD